MGENKPVKYTKEDVCALDGVVEEYSLGKLAGLSPFEQTFRLGAGIQKLKRMISSDMMGPIMQLQGTALGFRTDKDTSGGYAMEVVKDCLIEATLRGVRVTGNEFNILSARCYLTREGFTRLVREFPGLANLAWTLGVPRLAGSKSGAVVDVTASWDLNGTRMELACELPVRINAGMGSDAILGKAERKLLARVYKRITGSLTVPDGDAQEAQRDVRQLQAQIVDATPGTGMGAAAKVLAPPKETSAAPKPKAAAESKRRDASREAPGKKPPADNPPPSADEMAKADLTQSINDNCKRYGTGTIAGLDKFDLEELRQIAEDVPKDGFIAGDPMFLRREAEKATAVSTNPSGAESTGRLFEE